MANQQLEKTIRDWLAINLNFIESGLQLIQKEYFIKDNIGANGFIDLLCKDPYNNFVIIEIKRSNSSARQTINEILKYHSLIKHNYKARESEIRIIIISTHWEELIRPYSELFHRTELSLKGLKITTNPISSIPTHIELVVPLSKSILTRRMAWTQGLYLFKTQEKRSLFFSVLQEKLDLTPIEDFVVCYIDGPLDNSKVINPYGISFAFQKYSDDFLLEAIKKLGPRELDIMEPGEFDDNEAYERHLQGAFLDSLNMISFCDDLEAGYAEKLDSVLNNQGWQLKKINRSGIFQSDPRYSDDLVIKELIGHDGNSRNKFVGISESMQVGRLKEILEQCRKSLDHAPQWNDFIELLLNDLLHTENKFRLIIDIYNPDSIVSAFYFTISNASPDYLPIYKIVVDYIDIVKTEIYIGEIKWNGKKPTAKLFTSSNPVELANEVFRVNIMPDNMLDSIAMALLYTNRKYIIVNGNQVFDKFMKVKDNNIVLDHNDYKSIEDYITTNQQIIMKLISNFNKSYKIY